MRGETDETEHLPELSKAGLGATVVQQFVAR